MMYVVLKYCHSGEEVFDRHLWGVHVLAKNVLCFATSVPFFAMNVPLFFTSVLLVFTNVPLFFSTFYSFGDCSLIQ
jgi:hypothetical protein